MKETSLKSDFEEITTGATQNGNPQPFKNKEFLDTIEGMRSYDYRERFRAEYVQTKIRYERLKAFCDKIEAAMCCGDPFNDKKLDMPKHDCPYDLLRSQQRAMGEYLHFLELRAVIETIDIAF